MSYFNIYKLVSRNILTKIIISLQEIKSMIHRQVPFAKPIPINLAFCIILQNRLPLRFIPPNFSTYFINSKRKFFLYFKKKRDFEKTLETFEKQNVRYFKRQSMFPDRQEYQQILFHCNYKYKRRDLRHSLKPAINYKEPRNYFYQKYNQPIGKQIPFILKSTEILEKKASQLQKSFQKKESEKIIPQSEPQYLAEYGDIKVKSQRVLDILNNPSLIKQLFNRRKLGRR